LAIICFNHSDLEVERTARLKKIGGLEKEIRAAIRGVSDYFRINNDGKKITVTPHDENRRIVAYTTLKVRLKCDKVKIRI
jgi:hypothetical protein